MAIITGTAQSDDLIGGNTADTISGLGGDDVLRGGRGIDTLLGGEGNDSLGSGSLRSRLIGGIGDDRMFFGAVDKLPQIGPGGLADGGDGIDRLSITLSTYLGQSVTDDVTIDLRDGGGGRDIGIGLKISNIEYFYQYDGGSGIDIIYGGTLDDLILGRDGSDQLFGGGGVDDLHGGKGANILDGGDGNDTIYSNSSIDVVFGGQGDDVIFSELYLTENDNAIQDSGNFDGGDGVDEIWLSTNDDLRALTIDLRDGGLGRDIGDGRHLRNMERIIFSGSRQNDIVWAGNDNDYVQGRDGNDRLFGGGGADTLFGDAGRDIIRGGAGDDLVSIDVNDLASDNIDGGEGIDTISVDGFFSIPDVPSNLRKISVNFETGLLNLFGSTNTIFKNFERISIHNIYCENNIIGSKGDDFVNTGSYNDTIKSGDGNDKILDSGGNNIIDSGAGNDEITSYFEGVYNIAAGSEDDNVSIYRVLAGTIIDGGDGSDSLLFDYVGDAALVVNISDGGGGRDIGNGIRLSGFERLTEFHAHGGNDRITGGELSDLAFGGGGNDRLNGLGGDDELKGGDGSDYLAGGAGADKLAGENGTDTMTGSSGNDRILGGMGADILSGGEGADDFVYFGAAEGGDVITDFQAGDRISFLRGGFGLQGPAGAVDPTRFVSRADNIAQDDDDRFVFRTTDQTLWYDKTGAVAGATDAVLIADLQAGAVLTATDLVLFASWF